jgi:endonuclease YncB( thermonuclease family)
VVDGDTIKVEIDGEVYTVRYIGIDTPETVDLSKAVEWMGPEASAANKELVEGKTILLEKDVSETDRYGRLLRYVYVGDVCVNHELVRLGFAQVSTYPPDVKHADWFAEAQQEAREAKRGLWGATPTPSPAPTQTPQPTATKRPTPVPTQPPPTPVPTQPPPTPVPTQPPPTPVPTERPAPAPANVVISAIFFDGTKGRQEPDEYAQITNQGGTTVNLTGWRLNADDPGQDFWFPSFDLQPGQSCRVYTNESHPETCGFSFSSGQALWANSGECGHLFNAQGVEVSTYCY